MTGCVSIASVCWSGLVLLFITCNMMEVPPSLHSCRKTVCKNCDDTFILILSWCSPPCWIRCNGSSWLFYSVENHVSKKNTEVMNFLQFLEFGEFRDITLSLHVDKRYKQLSDFCPSMSTRKKSRHTALLSYKSSIVVGKWIKYKLQSHTRTHFFFYFCYFLLL